METMKALYFLLAIAIGFVVAIVLTRKITVWMDAARMTELISALQGDNKKKELEVAALRSQNRELKKQNALLEKEISEMRKTIEQLIQTNKLLEEKISARDFLIDEHTKIIKGLKKGYDKLDGDHEDFKQAICDFMVDVLKVEDQALKKFLRLNLKNNENPN